MKKISFPEKIAGQSSPSLAPDSDSAARTRTSRKNGNVTKCPLTVGAAQACEDLNTADFFETATVDDVRRCLKGGAGINARDGDGPTPLHFAAAGSSSSAVIRALLAAKADLHAHAGYELEGLHPELDGAVLFGWTPLHFAAADSFRTSIIVTLLLAGAEVNARDDLGFTPLHAAAALNPEPAVTAALLVAGAEVNARAEDAWSPLHAAAAFNPEPAVVEMLLDRGAELEALNRADMTPLHLAAAANGNSEVATLLLDRGADPKARTEDGKTAGDLAQDNENIKGSEVHRWLQVSRSRVCRHWRNRVALALDCPRENGSGRPFARLSRGMPDGDHSVGLA